MGPDMDGQGTALDETFGTTRHRAVVRPFIGVCPMVPIEVRLPLERLGKVTVNQMLHLGP